MITMVVIFSSNNSRAEPADERKIPRSAVAVIHCDYDPVSFWNKTTGTPSGFFVDLMDRVAAHAGLRVRYICRSSWDETITAIVGGGADLGVLLKSEEREKKLLFSTPIDTTYLSFFARSQSNIDPARVPSEYIVGVIKGSMSHEKLKDRKGLRLQIYGGYREGLFGLLAGEIGLFAGEESMVLKQMRETELEDRIKKVGKPFVELQRCMVVRKDNVQLLELMNNTLKDFVSGPEYERIYLKWYGAPMPYWTNRRVLTASGVFLIIAVSGVAFWRYVSISKINTELILTMSERDQAEVALRESEEKFRTLFESAVDDLFIIDTQGKIIDANRTACERLGYTKEEMLSKTIAELNTEEFSGAVPERIEHLLQYGHHVFEAEHRRKDGSAIPVEVNSKMMDFGGKKVLFSIIRDITERKRAEKQIQRSLREKETLLNEIHHRVKNNLAVISSLLGLQAQAINDESLSHALEESQQRIKSMALVHERLYQTRDFSCINYKDFINDIMKELEAIHHKHNGTIVTNLNIEDLTIDIDSAIPCSLIINELVTNAFKYAFPDNRSGELSISFAMEDDAYILAIKDNGVGLPKGVDYRKPTTLGLQIVNVLCKQLRGTFQMRSDRGTEAVITFKPKPAGNQYGKEKNTDS
jgi:PAS domain S-box-containing protein